MSDDDRTLKERIEAEMVIGPAPDSEPETRGRAAPVSTAECAEIRRRRRKGETTTEIGADLGVVNGVVSRHARGDERCSHAPEEVGSPVFGELTADECAEIRQRRRANDTVTAIAEDLGRSRTAVSRHATGAKQCDHDPDEVGEPVFGPGGGPTGHGRGGVSAGDCAAIRARRRVGEPLADIGEMLGRSLGTISEHARGGNQCSHDPAVVLPVDDAPPKKSYTDDELLEDLRAVAETHGERPSTTTVHGREEMASPSTYVNRFGSWSEALDAAGLPSFPVNARGE